MGCFATSAAGARVLYFTLFAVSTLISWLLHDYGGHVLALGGPSKSACAGAADVVACAAAGAPLRVAFGTTLFFAAHALALLCVTRSSDPRHVFHVACPLAQWTAWAALVVAGFFLPGHAVVGWGHAARALGGVYLFSPLLVVEALFAINSLLIDREDAPWSAPLLITSTAALYIGSAIALGFIGAAYAPAKGGCGASGGVIATAVLFILAATCLSITPQRPPSAGLFTAAGVSAYITCLVWTALAARPAGAHCPPPGGASTALRAVSIVITLLILAYVSLTPKSSLGALEMAEGGGSTSDDDEKDAVRPDFFHAVFAIGAAYVAMLFTKWEATPTAAAAASGGAGFGVPVATLVVTGCVYCFAMVAPALFPDRDFS